jgi:hypothetical protein
MKFGVFYNPMVPRAPGQQDWDPGQERKAFTEMLEQIRFADSLGFDYAFLGEHHFMPEYAHNSATEVLLGALAATTRNIRLGTGIVHASHNDPVRIPSASPRSTRSPAAASSSVSARAAPRRSSRSSRTASTAGASVRRQPPRSR